MDTGSSAPLPTAHGLGQSLVLFLGHVRHTLEIQVLDKGFRSSTKGVERIRDAVLFQRPQHAIDIGSASDIMAGRAV
jgi:hypothetical protein